MCRLVSPDVAAVERICIANPPRLGQRGQHRLIEAAPRPAIEAVVNRGARAVRSRAVAPAGQPKIRTCSMPEPKDRAAR